MFAQLGKHLFQGLKSPVSWEENHKARYGKIELINGKAVIQHTGEELSEMKLSVRYSIDFCDPASEIEALKQSMQAAEALPYITGEGSIVGKFVITSVSISNEMFSSTGRLEIAIVDLNLLEIANAEPSKKKGLALASAHPTVQKSPAAVSLDALVQQSPIAVSVPPVLQKPPIKVPSPANAITQDLSKAKSSVNAMKVAVSGVKAGLTSYKQAVRDVRKFADTAKQAYSSAKTKVEATNKMIQRASQLPASLEGAMKYAENLSKLDSLTNMETLKLSVTEMSNRADKVMGYAAPIAAFAGSKEGGD
jgi:phage protein U